MAQPVETFVVDREDGLVPPEDRGFNYGHGVFETLRVTDGWPPVLWSYHRERMLTGCRRLGIGLDAATLDDVVRPRLEGVRACVLKVLATAGDGERGYGFRAPAAARIVVMRYPPARPRADARSGVTAMLCATRLAAQPLLAGLKHLNRLEQVMARREWDDPGIAEGLMRDESDRLIEGTFTNLFLVMRDRVLTPRLEVCGVAGVMRAFVLEHRPGCASVPVEEAELSIADLDDANECFLTNSLIGAWPVTRIVGLRDFAPGRTFHGRTFDRSHAFDRGHAFDHRDWQRAPGRITRRLIEALDRELAFDRPV